MVWDKRCRLHNKFFCLLYLLMCGIPLMAEDTLHDPGAIPMWSQGAEGEFGGFQTGMENAAALLPLAPPGDGCARAQGTGSRGCCGNGSPPVPGLRGRNSKAVEGTGARAEGTGPRGYRGDAIPAEALAGVWAEEPQER